MSDSFTVLKGEKNWKLENWSIPFPDVIGEVGRALAAAENSPSASTIHNVRPRMPTLLVGPEQPDSAKPLARSSRGGFCARKLSGCRQSVVSSPRRGSPAPK